MFANEATSIKCMLDGNNATLSLKARNNSELIYGTVWNTDNETLPGVFISKEGKKVAESDSAGSFRLSIPIEKKFTGEYFMFGLKDYIPSEQKLYPGKAEITLNRQPTRKKNASK